MNCYPLEFRTVTFCSNAPAGPYTQSHIDYVVEAILEVNSYRARIRGMRIVEEPPFLRHFSARFDWAD